VGAAQIDPGELWKVPYLRADALGDRQAALTSLWDGADWHAWVPGPKGTLFHMEPNELAEGSYVAKDAARADDLHFPFADFMWKRASWPEVGHWYRAIVEDLHQIAASIAKVDFFWKTRDQAPGGALGARRFVSSELEYLLTVCRSVLDELQEIVRAIWERVREEHSFNEHAVSLRPALAHLVVTTLGTCNAFADVLGRILQFPPDIAPERRLFIRSVHGGALLQVQEVLRGGSPWWEVKA
jgi:hypothetical protein